MTRRFLARRVARGLLISVGTLAAAALLAEGGHRAWLRLDGRPYDPAATAERLRTMLSPIAAFVPRAVGTTLSDGKRRPILHPYSGAEEVSDTGGVLAHFRTQARPGDFPIVITGGSVAACFALTEGARLAQELGRDPRLAGRRVLALDYAHPAYKQPQQLGRLALLFSLGYRPAAVIEIDGFNEVALALQNALDGIHPVWPSPPVWGAVVEGIGAQTPERIEAQIELWQIREQAYDLARFCLKNGLQQSSLLGTLARKRMAALVSRRAEVQAQLGPIDGGELDEPGRRQSNGPDFDPDRKTVLEQCVRVWAESSRSMRALCESRGVIYLHVLQPALHDAGSKPATEAEAQMADPVVGWTIGARDGYPLLRAAGAELARGGERFLDASRAFADMEGTVYCDPCHFGPEGNARLCDLILKRLLEDAPAR